MRYFDSHAHLSDSELFSHRQAILERARLSGVHRILNICTNPLTLSQGLQLAEEYPHVLNAGSTTPHDVESEGESCFSLFAEAARSGKLAAVGETGLEYFHKGLDRALQRQFLVRYLHLAAECKLPVIFHCREAFLDLFAITDAEYPKRAPAILHCFTGTLGEAEQVIERGWYLSLSGIVTFKNSELLRRVAKWVPLEQLLIETDAPYLAPQSRRGGLNEPAFLVETAACIAAVKGIPVEEVAEATYANATQLFITRDV
jgi:TatD DNase family protein